MLKIVDWGDMSHDHGRPERFPADARGACDALVATGAKVLTLGGDHFITYPILKAHAKRHGPVALVQFDSHSDTWADDENGIDHGTMFFHAIDEGVIDAAHSVQIGIRSGNPETHGCNRHRRRRDDREPGRRDRRQHRAGHRRPAGLPDLRHRLPGPRLRARAPARPSAAARPSHRAERILTALTGLNIVGADIVEVSPPYDHAEITALAAATVAMNVLGLWAHEKGG